MGNLAQMKGGLERGFTGEGHWLFFQKTGNWFSAPTWQVIQRKKEGWEKGRVYRWLYYCPAPVQSEGPGIETLLSPAEDDNTYVLLQLRQRFSGLARCLGLMLRCVAIEGSGLGWRSCGGHVESSWGDCSEVLFVSLALSLGLLCQFLCRKSWTSSAGSLVSVARIL